MKIEKKWFSLCLGAMLVLGKVAIAGPVYFENWETGDGGWISDVGSLDRYILPGAPSGDWVQRITHTNAESAPPGYHYSSPFISVDPGQTYEVGAWINWVSGGASLGVNGSPFLGVKRYDSSTTYVGVDWLIGASTFSPPVVTQVLEVDGWHFYAAQITIPGDTTYIRLVDKLWGYGDPGRAGQPLGYFDGVIVTAVPVPGAILLGGIGVLCSTWLRRRRSL